MALVEPFMVKSEINLTTGETVTLRADTGESFLVKDIRVIYDNCKYCVVSIDRDTVGFFRLSGHTLRSHLYSPKGVTFASYSGLASTPSKTLLSLMVEKGFFRGFPIAEGQKLTISPYPENTYLKNVVIVYEKYEAGDIKKEDVNGSEAKEYIYIVYGHISEEVKNAGEYVYDVMINPEEFADFPFERECPAKTEIEVLGITGWEAISVADGSNYTYTKYLKLFKGRKLLFDSEKKGLPLYQSYWAGASGQVGGNGFSLVGQYTEKDYRLPLFFDTPIKFTPGEELRLILDVGAVGDGSAFSEEFLELGVILRAKVME